MEVNFLHRQTLRDICERFPLDGLPFPSLPGYRGHPWFLPLVGGWYRLMDRVERMAA